MNRQTTAAESNAAGVDNAMVYCIMVASLFASFVLRLDRPVSIVGMLITAQKLLYRQNLSTSLVGHGSITAFILLKTVLMNSTIKRAVRAVTAEDPFI